MLTWLQVLHMELLSCWTISKAKETLASSVEEMVSGFRSSSGAKCEPWKQGRVWLHTEWTLGSSLYTSTSCDNTVNAASTSDCATSATLSPWHFYLCSWLEKKKKKKGFHLTADGMLRRTWDHVYYSLRKTRVASRLHPQPYHLLISPTVEVRYDGWKKGDNFS